MATDTTDDGTMVDATTEEDQEWGRISLAVLISVLLTLAAHYLLIAGIEMHPSLHALAGVVLFFVAGIIMFKIVLF